nr:XdhC/CoxI family protein [uncultured Blautia sp.]
MRILFQTIKQHFLKGDDLVLASIIASSGSTPRGAGSHMLVSKRGRVAGTIGGGSVEYRAGLMALEILDKKESCEHEFKLNREDVENIGMICGGDVTVFFQYLDHKNPVIMDIAVTAEKLYEERKDFWLICDLHSVSDMSLYSSAYGLIGNAKVPASILSSLSARPRRHCNGDYDLFTEQIGTSGTVYVFGGGHVSQKLVPILASVDFHCVVLDDRPEFTDPALFSDAVETILCDFDHLDRSITITEEDYCCVMTRGHAYDTLVQAYLLSTPACYIGVMGSRSKKSFVFRRLVEEYGIDEGELDRIVSPIGLEIKAETPAEIAISITGQMIQVRAERKTSAK